MVLDSMSVSLSETPVRRTEDRFSAADGRVLFRRSWSPPNPCRQVVLVHGFGEHCGRYEAFATWLAERGCSVHAYDQQGHGQSPGPRGHATSFDGLLDDLAAFMDWCAEEEPGLRRVLLGHSMGGLVVSSFACERAPEIDLLVTTGAALSLSPDLSSLKLFMARLLCNLVPRLGLAAGLDANEISSDDEVVAAYVADPLVHGRMTAGMGGEMLASVERTVASASRVRVPTLLLHGEADRLCLPSGSEAFYAGLPHADVTGSKLKTYPGLKHEILNEPSRAVVYQDVLDWIEAREAALN
jgi:acylglycerol lipase